MRFWAGIDLGTVFTAAAVLRDGQQRAEMIELGRRSTVMPSVVHIGRDGDVVVGELAEDRAAGRSAGAARAFKRWFGSDSPILLNSHRWTAENLTQAVLRYVLERIVAHEHAAPAGLVLTHPAAWGSHRTDALRHLAEQVSGVEIRLLPEPVAAAVHAAAADPSMVGGLVGVYDLGGGTFDAAVVRVTDDGARLVGTPSGVDAGGAYFDDVVFEHLQRSRPELFADPEDTFESSLLTSVRELCRRAREALSDDPSVTISFATAGGAGRVRFTRDELESAIRDAVDTTIDVFERTLEAAGARPEDLDRILVVGGASPTPLVLRRLTERFARPLATTANPKHNVALGAAASSRLAPARSPSPPAVADPGGSLLPSGPTVVAVLCVTGHPMEPGTGRCPTCGAGVGDPVPRPVARPVLWELRFDDGQAVVLDRPLLLGRQPAAAASRTGEQVGLVALDDADLSLSRVHAEVSFDSWHVVVSDLGSLNGTFVESPGVGPRPLGRGERFVLGSDCVVSLSPTVRFRLAPLAAPRDRDAVGAGGDAGS